MMNALKVLGTFVLMVFCGVVAFAATAFSLFELGLELLGNFDYFFAYPHSFGVALSFVAGAIGFLAPGVIVWKRHNFAEYKIPSQFGLRTLLIVMTVIAVILGLAVLLYRIRW
jgi:hypothetical protein